MDMDKDKEQDEMIRRNAEHIRRNEEAIRRQTECLEKIRDHYFPQATLWRRVSTYFVKVVGAVAVYAGLMETGDWYLNTRKSNGMAEQSAAVAKRLFLQENDPAGALQFLDKAIELDEGRVAYRIARAYVKGMGAVVEYFDLGRPLTPDERARVDAILAEAVFLQEVEAENPMPYVLAAQGYLLRDEPAAARQAMARAVALAPEDVIVRIHACSVAFACGDWAGARAELSAAEKLDDRLFLVPFWRGRLAVACDHDWEAATRHFTEMARRAPRVGLTHVMLGRALMNGTRPDYAAARAEFAQALKIMPRLWKAYALTCESYVREGNAAMARLWADRLLAQNATSMDALTARARLYVDAGDGAAAAADLTAAIALAPFRADLYRVRARARTLCGDSRAAAEDEKTATALEREQKKNPEK